MTRYSVGSTIKVSNVAETSPPMMTMASGRWVSEPMPRERAHGQKAEHCQQRRHHHGAQTRASALKNGVVRFQAFVLKLVEIAHHHDAI